MEKIRKYLEQRIAELKAAQLSEKNEYVKSILLEAKINELEACLIFANLLKK